MECVKDNPESFCRCSDCSIDRRRSQQDGAVREVMGLAGRHGIAYEQAALALIIDALWGINDVIDR